MRIFAADDEPLALEMLCDAISEAAPSARIEAFSKPSLLLEAAAASPADVVFLDIRMRGMSGMELAKKLKALSNETNIVFVTGYESYSLDAITMHASGYILKPVTAEKIRSELSNLRYPPKTTNETLLKIKCFGNFDVYTSDGEIVNFERKKAKELLAYLIYLSGASCSVKEIAARLFEDGVYDKKQQSYVQKIISSLIQTLKSVGAKDVIIKKYNSLSIDVSLVDCDYYHFIASDEAAVNSYFGEFMSQYAWAEFAIGYLEKIYRSR